MTNIQPNREFAQEKCLAILSRGQLIHLDRFREQLPKVLPGVQIICPDDLDDMSEKLRRSHDTHELVLVIGGDGTLNRVLQDVDCDRQVLGILPSGTGNDFASFLGFPAGFDARINYLSGLSSQNTDYGMLGDIRFINSAGFGIDTETLRERERHSSLIRSNYNLLFLLALSKMQCSEVQVQAGDYSESGRFYWILGMNSALIGGGTRIAPDARIDDGKLDMLLIRETSKFEMLKLMPAAIKGRHVGKDMVEYRQVESFSISSEKQIEILAVDGECYDWGRREVEVRCIPEGIRMLR